MYRMKKLLYTLTALCVSTLSVCALAAPDLSDCSITDATVEAVSHIDVTAPCSGTLAAFDAEPGDAVSAGEKLFSYLTTDVYAPVDGTLSELFISEGEPTAYAMTNYGCLGSIAPAIEQRMNCSTAGAHDDVEGEVTVGQTLYFKSSSGDKDEGFGRVISRTGENFVLEILKGHYDKGERLTLYQTPARKSKEAVGKGYVVHADPVALNGNGVVSAVYVEKGQPVKKGDKLFSLLAADADPNASAEVAAPESGVIGSIAVVSGQQVWKGELLLRLLLTDELEIVAQVDEADLRGLSVGDSVYVTVDTDKSNVMTGTVTEISSLGITRANAAYFAVHVSVEEDARLMLGQSANLYLSRN